MADAEGITVAAFVDNLLRRAAELERRSRFPLNETPGDVSDVWGRPIVTYEMGTLYVCPHGHAVLVGPNGQLDFMNEGHWCEFRSRP